MKKPSQMLDPNPFLARPGAMSDSARRAICVERIMVALDRLKRGEISIETFRDDKAKEGARWYLWYCHHDRATNRWKYLGRRNWTLAAYESFRRQYLSIPLHARNDQLGPAEDCVPYKRQFGPQQIQHEHVIPQTELLDWLLKESHPVAHILTQNIGAVVTAEEHRGLPRHNLDWDNPWRRYSGLGIKFLRNPSWNSEEIGAFQRYDLIAN